MFVYETEPVKYDDDPDYVYAICECPVDMSYGLKIPKKGKHVNDGINNSQFADYAEICVNVAHFKCKKCGCSGSIYFH